jgi:hypothetical protein
VVFGFDSNGLPKRSTITPGNAVFGIVQDARVVPSGASSTRWQVEVLCRGIALSGSNCNPGSNLTWEAIGSTETGFNRSFGGRVEQYYAIREDGQPDNCAIVPTPIPLPNPGSQVLVLPRSNPTIQRYFDVDIPVTIQERGQPLSLDLELPDATLQVDFNIDGISFSVEGSEFNLDLDVGGISQQIQNTENNLSLELESQINNQNNFIQQQNQELAIELSNEFELELETQLGDLNVTAEVDLSPVLIAIDNVVEVIQRECDCEPCDIQPILDRLSELDIKFSERLDTLEENVVEAIEGLKRFLECYLSALWVNTRVALPGDTQQLGQWTSSQADTVRIFNVPATAIAVGLTIDDYDQKFVRVYKFDDDPMEIEAGYGHCSLLSAGSILSFDLVSTRRVALAVPKSVPVGGFRVSLKPGIRISAWAVLSELPDQPICE